MNKAKLTLLPVAFLIVLLGIQVTVARVFNSMKDHLGEAPLPARQEAPLPRLQVDEAADLRAYREQEHKMLESYGWVDRKSGTVRIPIEKAMERIQ